MSLPIHSCSKHVFKKIPWQPKPWYNFLNFQWSIIEDISRRLGRKVYTHVLLRNLSKDQTVRSLVVGGNSCHPARCHTWHIRTICGFMSLQVCGSWWMVILATLFRQAYHMVFIGYHCEVLASECVGSISVGCFPTQGYSNSYLCISVIILLLVERGFTLGILQTHTFSCTLLITKGLNVGPFYCFSKKYSST